MPVQWFAGFEAGDTNELIGVAGSVALGGDYARLGGAFGCRITAPTGVGTAYLSLANGYDSYGNPVTVARNTYTLGAALRVVGLPAGAGTAEHLIYVAASSTHRASLRLGQDGTLRLHVGSSGSAALATWGPVVLNRWQYHELAVEANRVTWWIDGQVVYRAAATPGGTMNAAYIGKRANLALQGYTVDVDDLYTADDLTFLGPTTRVAWLGPNGAGTDSGWLTRPGEEPPPEVP